MLTDCLLLRRWIWKLIDWRRRWRVFFLMAYWCAVAGVGLGFAAVLSWWLVHTKRRSAAEDVVVVLREAVGLVAHGLQ